MNKGLKNKGLGSWFCLAAALVALITGIVFLLTQATAAPLGHSGTMAGVVLLVGAAASLVFFFVSVPKPVQNLQPDDPASRSHSPVFSPGGCSVSTENSGYMSSMPIIIIRSLFM